MGDSKLAPGKDDKFTIESLARDLLLLLTHLQWKDLSICGFSMGGRWYYDPFEHGYHAPPTSGVISQQLLFLPYHPTRAVILPFRVTHVILAGTLCSTLKDLDRYGLRINMREPSKPLGLQERRNIARATLERTFDPAWLANPTNSVRFEWWLERMISGGRPTSVILKQARAVNRFNFDGYHDKLPRDIRFLVIHGELDEVVPFYCGREILQRIPWAKPVEIGSSRGQVQNYAFGHHWFEYFDIQVWHDVVERFLIKQNQSSPNARL
ncbi:hypothetical protein C0991_002400 [Blastosporella zonata]|nr:hypothetical protein C0991_002400 [Blastosporella zonata]